MPKDLLIRRCFRGIRVCALLLPLAAVLLPGCVSLELTQTRVVDAPWVWEGEGYRVTLLMEPEAPVAGKTVRLALRVESGPGKSARPVDGAEVSCSLYMAEEPGHIHIMGPHPHTETAPGLYPMEPMAFEMGGVWVLDAKIRLPEGRTLNARFRINVEGPPWPPSHVPPGPKKPVR